MIYNNSVALLKIKEFHTKTKDGTHTKKIMILASDKPIRQIRQIAWQNSLHKKWKNRHVTEFDGLTAWLAVPNLS